MTTSWIYIDDVVIYVLNITAPSGVDYDDVETATLAVRPPGGGEVEWSATIVARTGTTMTLTHEFEDGERPSAGTYAIYAKLFGADEALIRRSDVALLSVGDKFAIAGASAVGSVTPSPNAGVVPVARGGTGLSATGDVGDALIVSAPGVLGYGPAGATPGGVDGDLQINDGGELTGIARTGGGATQEGDVPRYRTGKYVSEEPVELPDPIGLAVGTMLVWGGTEYVAVPPSDVDGKVLTWVDGAPAWVTPTGGGTPEPESPSVTFGANLKRLLTDYSPGTWFDQSPSAINATQATGNRQPAATTTPGGKDALTTDGLNTQDGDCLGLNDATNTLLDTDFTIGFTMMVPSIPASGKVFMAKWVTGNRKIDWSVFTDGKFGGYVNNTTPYCMSNAPIADGVWRRFIITRSATSGVMSLYVDGVLQTATNTVAGGMTPSSDPICLFATGNPAGSIGNPLGCSVSGFVVANVVADATQRAKLDDWLAWRLVA